MNEAEIVRVLCEYMGWTANHYGGDYWNAFDERDDEREVLQSLDDLRPIVARVLADENRVLARSAGDKMAAAMFETFNGDAIMCAPLRAVALPPLTIARCLAEAIKEAGR